MVLLKKKRQVFVNVDLKCKKSPGRLSKGGIGRLTGCNVVDVHGKILAGFLSYENLVNKVGKPPYACSVSPLMLARSMTGEILTGKGRARWVEPPGEIKIIECEPMED